MPRRKILTQPILPPHPPSSFVSFSEEHPGCSPGIWPVFYASIKRSRIWLAFSRQVFTHLSREFSFSLSVSRFSLDTIPPDSIVLDYTEFRRDNFGRPIFPRSFDSLFLYTNAFFSPPILCTFGIFVARFFVDDSSLETMELFVG